MRTKVHETAGDYQETAVLVGLTLRKDTRALRLEEESMKELASLADTAGVKTAAALRQHRDAPDPKWFVGKGKAEEIRAVLREHDANTVIFDHELSGAQVRNLEQFLDAKIIDRTQLILDIFAQRARTREGIIQVELAQLNYLLPRLYGQGLNLSRLGGGIGTRGPGETKLETDRRHIRRRIDELRRELDKVVKHRLLHRERRRKNGVFQIALVGYTNAGKSTLLNRLCHADAMAENKLFATLDPLSRELTLGNGAKVLLTDTVGFIQRLPHDLVSAFGATLEEVCEADLILHVVDASSPMRDEQQRVVNEVLQELGAQSTEQLLIFNKKDRCSPEMLDMLPRRPDTITVSAYSDGDLEQIREAIEDRNSDEMKILRIPADKGDLVALAYRLGEVREQEVDGEQVILHLQPDSLQYRMQGHLLTDYEQHP